MLTDGLTDKNRLFNDPNMVVFYFLNEILKNDFHLEKIFDFKRKIKFRSL